MDGGLGQMEKRRGRYKSTPLVRGLRLQRLKDTSMSITASLDKRKAVALGETVLPEPKVYGRKGGQFSDITRLLSGGTGGGGGSTGSAAGAAGGSTILSSSSSSSSSGKKGGSMASLLSQQPSTDIGGSTIEPAIDPQDIEDDRQVALLLNTQRKKRGRRADANGEVNKEFIAFENSLTKKERSEWKLKCDEEVIRITRSLRSKYQKKKNQLDDVGLFHPMANQMRMDTAFHAELKKNLQMHRIEEKCLRNMWLESKGEAPKLSRKNSTTNAMENKFATMMNSSQDISSSSGSSVLDGGPSTAKGSTKGGSVASVKSSASSSKGNKNKLKNNSGTSSVNTKNMGKRGGGSSGDGKNKEGNGKKVHFQPGDEVNKMEGSRIASETRTQLKDKVKNKFASGKADIEAEKYADGNGDEVMEEEEEEEEEEEDDVWDGDEIEDDGMVADGSSSVIGGGSSLKKSSKMSSNSKRGSNGGGGLEDSMEIGSTLADGSVVVDPKAPEDRYSEYEIRYDEWGQEVKVKLPPKVAPMAKTKKDTRVDPFEVFKKKKMAEARAKKIKRHQLLKNGNMNTSADSDFKNDLGYRTSTIKQALGHGKHTPSKLFHRPSQPVGSNAINKPLPGYIKNEMRMAKKDAGLGVDYTIHEPSHVTTEPSSVPSWAVTTEPSVNSQSPALDTEDSTLSGGVSAYESVAMVGEGDAVVEGSEEKKEENEPIRTNILRHQKLSDNNSKTTMRNRLETVWEKLEMPYGLKMQFAARYSEPRRAESMNDILPLWEKVTLFITMRERLLIVLYNLRQKFAQRVDVHHRDVFEYDEVSQLKSMNCYIDFVQKPMLPDVWVCEIFHLVTNSTIEQLEHLFAEYEDIVTFRGHPYLKVIKEQSNTVEKNGPGFLEPVQYVGNPFLRRTGKLLVNP